MIDCSYDPSFSEILHISNALTGQYYLMLITNYSNQTGNITFNQTNYGQPGAGSTDCSIVQPCDILTLTSTPSICNSTNNTYFVNITITFVNEPNTGQLIISDNTGASQTFNAPFISPVNFNLTGLISDGSPHTITAVFTDSPSCLETTTYVAPPLCITCSTNAGSDASICGLNYTLSATEQITDINTHWLPTTNITFSDINSPISTIIASLPGQYILIWEITNSLGLTCNDTVIITFNSIPTVSIIQDTVSCWGVSDGSLTANPSNGLTPYQYNWSNGFITQTISNLSIGYYQVTVTDVNGCSVVGGGSVTTPTQMFLTSTVTNLTCPYTTTSSCNGSIFLNVSGGILPYSYYWSNGQTTSTLNNICPDNYSVTISDANGCTITQQFVITSPPQFTNIFTTTNPACNGQNNGSIFSNVNGGTQPYIYHWNNNVTTPSLTNLIAGQYSMQITDANQCIFIDTISLYQPTPVIVTTPSSITICIGQDATISASSIGGSGVYNYMWSNGMVGQTIVVNPTQNTTYSVTVTDSNGCISNISNTQINVIPNMVIIPQVSDNTICAGESIILNASITNGNPPYMIYLNGQQISLPTTIFPNTTQTYTIAVDHICGQVQETIDVIVYNPQPVSFLSDVLDGCQSLIVNFIPIPDTTYQYFWNFHDNSNSQISYSNHPQHTFKNNGSYDVTLIVTDNHGCTSTQTLYNFINVYPNPHSAFTTNQNIASDINPQIYFYNLSQGASNYIWSFGDGDSTSIVHPIHFFRDYNDFLITLIAVSNHGCTDTSELIITIYEECSFYAPTAFSPDYDNINDHFKVFGKCISDDFNLYVYDRWGEIIWEGNNINDYWDGRAKNHEFVPIGLYTWLCRYKTTMGVYKEHAGYVTVIR